jgi:hypothetical protein
LPKHEKEAWEQLDLWAGEADFRAQDVNYAAFHVAWLGDLQAQLARAATSAPSGAATTSKE